MSRGKELHQQPRALGRNSEFRKRGSEGQSKATKHCKGQKVIDGDNCCKESNLQKAQAHIGISCTYRHTSTLVTSSWPFIFPPLLSSPLLPSRRLPTPHLHTNAHTHPPTYIQTRTPTHPPTHNCAHPHAKGSTRTLSPAHLHLGADAMSMTFVQGHNILFSSSPAPQI